MCSGGGQVVVRGVCLNTGWSRLWSVEEGDDGVDVGVFVETLAGGSCWMVS